MKRRGYSIVEAAIVLTAFMLLVGGMAWPVAQRIRADQDESERAYMESMKEAVIAYAMRSRTPGGTMQIEFPFTGLADMTVNITIPAGRPYLPCPDIDADGFEDRVTSKVSGVVTITAVANMPERLLLSRSDFGMCSSDRGLFPWRTLGTKPADYWGQHYDYYVHRLLASPLLGFDETSDAVGYLSLLAVSRETEPCAYGDWLPDGLGYRRGARVSEGALGYPALDDDYAFLPTMVGSIADQDRSVPPPSAIPVNLETAGGGNVFDANFLQDRRRLANGSGGQVSVLRYCWLREGGPAMQRYYRANRSAAVGTAFAIVSHGRNGYGGVRHVPPGEARTIATSDCNSFPGGGGSVAFFGEMRNGDCIPTAAPRTVFPDHYFLIYDIPAPGVAYDLEYDDLLTWMMPRQLFNELAQVGAMPKPPAIKILEF